MLIGCHFDLSVIALIGIILLIGIVKKNGIMMVDFAIPGGARPTPVTGSLDPPGLPAAVPANHDDDHGSAVGALPLMLGHGTGSELRQPLGYTMVGGLILSQALTLFTTPVVYLYLDRLNERVSAIARRPSRMVSRARRAGAPRMSLQRSEDNPSSLEKGAVKVLLVEDNERVTRFVVKGLQEAGSCCRSCGQRTRWHVPGSQ